MKTRLSIDLTEPANKALREDLTVRWKCSINAAIEMMVRAHAGLPLSESVGRFQAEPLPEMLESPDFVSAEQKAFEERGFERTNRDPVVESPLTAGVITPPETAPQADLLDAVAAGESPAPIPIPAEIVRDVMAEDAPPWVQELVAKMMDGEEPSDQEMTALRRYRAGLDVTPEGVVPD